MPTRPGNRRLLRADYLVTPSSGSDRLRVIPDGAVCVVGDTISDIGPAHEVKRRYPDADEMGGSGLVLMPGLVDAHQHGRGVSSVERGMVDLPLELWLMSSRASQPIDAYLATALSAAKSLSSGVTSVVHAHATKDLSGYRSGALAVAQAYADSGIRATFALDLRDRGFFTYEEDATFLGRLPPDVRRTALAAFPVRESPPPAAVLDSMAEIESLSPDGLLVATFGPSGPQWCSPQMLSSIRRLASDSGRSIHMHCAESLAQRRYFLHGHGVSPVQYLDRSGVLGPDVVLAHCVWADEGDIEILASTGTGVVHAPGSNLRTNAGIAPVSLMLQAGVSVGLGTDSLMHDDEGGPFDEARLAGRLCALPGRRPTSRIDPQTWLRIATMGGAHAMSGQSVGSLEPGHKADAIFLDLERLRGFGATDVGLPDAIYYRGRTSLIRHVLVGGRLVYSDGRILTVDVDRISEEIVRHVRDAPTGWISRRDAISSLVPYVESYVRELTNGTDSSLT